MALKGMIKKSLKRFGYQIKKIPRIEYRYGPEACLNFENPSIVKDLLLSYCYLISKNFFFIQIGANDGIMRDQIYDFVQKYNLAGLVVEPIDDYYQELKENYGNNKNVIPVKKALHHSKKKETIYRMIKDHPFDEAYNGLGSFNLDNLMKYKDPKQTPEEWLVPNIEDYIIEEEVECITFEQLISEYNVRKVDLLQIDTEGFDFEIIKMIDFDVVKPRIVRYEVINLSEDDFFKCVNLLIKNGYKIYDEGYDIIATCMR
jgi:FkbM family methyltransferase